MNKKAALTVFIFVLALMICGGAAAADTSNAAAITDSGTVSGTEGGSASNTPNLENNTTSISNVENEIFVRFNSNITDLAQTSMAAHSQIGATVIKDFKEVPGLQLVKIPETIKIQDAIARYQQNPDVLYAESNYKFRTEVIPNDSYYSSLWGLTKINAPSAWDITTGSSNVIIAVLDTGVDINHPDLQANIWINTVEIPGNGIDDDDNDFIDDVYGWNFLNDNNIISDDNGHGTHVAGIIGAVGNNAQGTTGVMWNVKIMALKFLGSTGKGDVNDAIEAINYARLMGAHIISNSWGGPDYSQALKDIIDASQALFVCAAGNDPYYGGDNNDVTPTYPASYLSPNIIAVAASDQNDNLASFSNYGLNSVDVTAPGVSIYSTKPSSSYGYLSGTSMATPYVSGLAGLIKALRPDLNNLEIKSTILNNVDYISSLAGKILTSGRINAYKALSNIVTDTTLPTASADPKGGSYYSPLSVSLTSSEPGNIYLTTDGSTPTKASFIYNTPLYIDKTTTVKFVAADAAGNLSPVYIEVYSIYRLVGYSYVVSIPYKKGWYKQWYKKAYKKWYRRGGKRYYYWAYRWKYRWMYGWLYRYETRYGSYYALT
ncbi:MAG: peptidase S8/S53 subtilisin kexin sedolisin [Euryarchaeota archaeon]|nr:peptidase S8/S53 subtilisin kexin sedolisin [Euryarchaeota archaeon]